MGSQGTWDSRGIRSREVARKHDGVGGREGLQPTPTCQITPASRPPPTFALTTKSDPEPHASCEIVTTHSSTIFGRTRRHLVPPPRSRDAATTPMGTTGLRNGRGGAPCAHLLRARPHARRRTTEQALGAQGPTPRRRSRSPAAGRCTRPLAVESSLRHHRARLHQGLRDAQPRHVATTQGTFGRRAPTA